MHSKMRAAEFNPHIGGGSVLESMANLAQNDDLTYACLHSKHHFIGKDSGSHVLVDVDVSVPGLGK
jgi:hypothetical protein